MGKNLTNNESGGAFSLILPLTNMGGGGGSGEAKIMLTLLSCRIIAYFFLDISLLIIAVFDLN